MCQASAIDTSNFDEEFTSEVPLDSVVDDSHLSQTVQQQLWVHHVDAVVQS